MYGLCRAILGPGGFGGQRAAVAGPDGSQDADVGLAVAVPIAGHGLIADTDVWLLELSKQRLGGLLKQRPAADHTFHGNLASSLRAAQGKAEAAAQGAVEEDEHDVRRDEL